jgi:RecA-family ATPase
MKLHTITAAQLEITPFPPPRQLVNGLLTAGLCILAGAPKSGKSWLSLDLALSVANGTPALGAYGVEQADVLYLALEDTPYRLKSRLRAMRKPHPVNLHFATSAPRLGEGGIEAIDDFVNANPGTSVVIVDTLAKISDAKTTNNIYDEDAAVGTVLHALAHHHNLALVVIHHTRKQAHGDYLQSVSGSSGLTGTADVVMVLNRTRNEQVATLEVTGRDILEATANLRWNTTAAGWLANTDFRPARL